MNIGIAALRDVDHEAAVAFRSMSVPVTGTMTSIRSASHSDYSVVPKGKRIYARKFMTKWEEGEPAPKVCDLQPDVRAYVNACHRS